MKRHSEISEQEELEKSQNAIRKKYKKLKLKDVASKEYLKQTFNPVIEPLNTIIKSNAALQNMTKLITEGNKSETYNDDRMDDDHFENGTENNENDEEKVLKTPLKNTKTPIDPTLKNFFQLHYDQKNIKSLDRIYGIRSDGKNWLLGDSPIEVEDDQIKIKGQSFTGTMGLYELLFLKNPNKDFYNAKDLGTYKEMLQLTNAHKQSYESKKQINSNRGNKYITVIKGLFQTNTGSGVRIGGKLKGGVNLGSGVNLDTYVNLNSVRHEYWDDPNELADRLRLLVAAQQAGNNNVQNEILSIIEELREAHIIE
jgi:hypothetical protein